MKKKNNQVIKTTLIDPYRKEPIKSLLNKPPLVRMGGKRYLSSLLVKRINSYDYSMYIEAFFGGGRVYFEKDPHFTEIINDNQTRLANFFYCCRHFSTELEELQKGLIKDENRFMDLYEKYHNDHELAVINGEISWGKEQWENKTKFCLTGKKQILDHAIDFFFYSNMAFRGSLTAKTMTYFENDPRTENNRMRWRIFRPLGWIGNRMRRTMVLNQDFTKIFKLGLNYSNHSRLWFLDPPYLNTEGYEDDFNWEKYEQLNECLKQLPKTDYFLLTLNQKPEIEELFSWCKCEKVQTHYTTGGAGQRKEVCENLFTPPWDPKKKRINLSKFMEAKSN